MPKIRADFFARRNREGCHELCDASLGLLRTVRDPLGNFEPRGSTVPLAARSPALPRAPRGNQRRMRLAQSRVSDGRILRRRKPHRGTTFSGAVDKKTAYLLRHPVLDGQASCASACARQPRGTIAASEQGFRCLASAIRCEPAETESGHGGVGHRSPGMLVQRSHTVEKPRITCRRGLSARTERAESEPMASGNA